MSAHGAAWDPRFADRDPRFAPIAAAARAFERDAEWPAVERWNERLDAAGLSVPVVFVPQRAPIRRRGGDRAPYDREVAGRGRVPSRERSWHDFFNMLAWAAFPRTKAAIHARQVEASEGEGTHSGANRGPERDALAMLDEGGVIVVVRPGARAMHLLGHAVYEHLVEARPENVLAAALEVEGDDVDAAAGARIADRGWTPSAAALGRIPVSWIGATTAR